MSIVAVAGDACTTTAVALASAWPVADDVILRDALFLDHGDPAYLVDRDPEGAVLDGQVLRDVRCEKVMERRVQSLLRAAYLLVASGGSYHPFCCLAVGLMCPESFLQRPVTDIPVR